MAPPGPLSRGGVKAGDAEGLNGSAVPLPEVTQATTPIALAPKDFTRGGSSFTSVPRRGRYYCERLPCRVACDGVPDVESNSPTFSPHSEGPLGHLFDSGADDTLHTTKEDRVQTTPMHFQSHGMIR